MSLAICMFPTSSAQNFDLHVMYCTKKRNESNRISSTLSPTTCNCSTFKVTTKQIQSQPGLNYGPLGLDPPLFINPGIPPEMFRFTRSSSNKDMLGPTLQRHQVQPEQRQIDSWLLQATESPTEDVRMIDPFSTWTRAAAQAVVLPQLPEQTSRKQRETKKSRNRQPHRQWVLASQKPEHCWPVTDHLR